MKLGLKFLSYKIFQKILEQPALFIHTFKVKAINSWRITLSIFVMKCNEHMYAGTIGMIMGELVINFTSQNYTVLVKSKLNPWSRSNT